MTNIFVFTEKEFEGSNVARDKSLYIDGAQRAIDTIKWRLRVPGRIEIYAPDRSGGFVPLTVDKPGSVDAALYVVDAVVRAAMSAEPSYYGLFTIDVIDADGDVTRLRAYNARWQGIIGDIERSIKCLKRGGEMFECTYPMLYGNYGHKELRGRIHSSMFRELLARGEKHEWAAARIESFLTSVLLWHTDSDVRRTMWTDFTETSLASFLEAAEEACLALQGGVVTIDG